MHVLFSLLLYWLLSYIVDFLVGTFKKNVSASTFFLVLLFFNVMLHIIFSSQHEKKVGTTLFCAYLVEIHSL